MTREMRNRIRDHLGPAVLGLVLSGCGPTLTELETLVLPEPKPPARGDGLPQAYPRSQINDPRLRALTEEYRTWVLQRRSAGPNPVPLFSRLEVLPPVLTVLPYGVGAYEQEPRLPVIVTTGPGWTAQEPEAKEAIAAGLFGELSQRLAALALQPPLRPSLTIQTASGLELSWINDLVPGRRNVHGDEELTLAAPPPLSVPPPPRAVERGTNLHGNHP
jgi:hypothetical protein